ncbi:uncharacterized protein AMSG_10525 [Thecamonas trahens ATCC 50062]|uniref:Uncharacterized protein n=1 Tax=Thecamonas trahens ATCC 50062 TaxID=461836 RepID=A0A0L0DS54_THETB|nr:hypothetical protein AMSG_10525 [Thecamonas trahens ATCC 50062]KNC54871.1 hypothetical protein AMSG_10525 [Thecamonas trahens ATCC 50062]|eukprot:XP_013753467.1 hypothetical protein AMSG_10525 [Thecamonas trahens ATCC 50062]
MVPNEVREYRVVLGLCCTDADIESDNFVLKGPRASGPDLNGCIEKVDHSKSCPFGMTEGAINYPAHPDGKTGEYGSPPHSYGNRVEYCCGTIKSAASVDQEMCVIAESMLGTNVNCPPAFPNGNLYTIIPHSRGTSLHDYSGAGYTPNAWYTAYLSNEDDGNRPWYRPEARGVTSLSRCCTGSGPWSGCVASPSHPTICGTDNPNGNHEGCLSPTASSPLWDMTCHSCPHGGFPSASVEDRLRTPISEPKVCQYDLCGNGVIDGDEQCDVSRFYSNADYNLDLAAVASGSLPDPRPMCSDQCKWIVPQMQVDYDQTTLSNSVVRITPRLNAQYASTMGFNTVMNVNSDAGNQATLASLMFNYDRVDYIIAFFPSGTVKELNDQVHGMETYVESPANDNQVQIQARGRLASSDPNTPGRDLGYSEWSLPTSRSVRPCGCNDVGDGRPSNMIATQSVDSGTMSLSWIHNSTCGSVIAVGKEELRDPVSGDWGPNVVIETRTLGALCGQTVDVVKYRPTESDVGKTIRFSAHVANNFNGNIFQSSADSYTAPIVVAWQRSFEGRVIAPNGGGVGGAAVTVQLIDPDTMAVLAVANSTSTSSTAAGGTSSTGSFVANIYAENTPNKGHIIRYFGTSASGAPLECGTAGQTVCDVANVKVTGGIVSLSLTDMVVPTIRVFINHVNSTCEFQRSRADGAPDLTIAAFTSTDASMAPIETTATVDLFRNAGEPHGVVADGLQMAASVALDITYDVGPPISTDLPSSPLGFVITAPVVDIIVEDVTVRDVELALYSSRCGYDLGGGVVIASGPGLCYQARFDVGVSASLVTIPALAEVTFDYELAISTAVDAGEPVTPDVQLLATQAGTFFDTIYTTGRRVDLALPTDVPAVVHYQFRTDIDVGIDQIRDYTSMENSVEICNTAYGTPCLDSYDPSVCSMATMCSREEIRTLADGSVVDTGGQPMTDSSLIARYGSVFCVFLELSETYTVFDSIGSSHVETCYDVEGEVSVRDHVSGSAERVLEYSGYVGGKTNDTDTSGVRIPLFVDEPAMAAPFVRELGVQIAPTYYAGSAAVDDEAWRGPASQADLAITAPVTHVLDVVVTGPILQENGNIVEFSVSEPLLILHDPPGDSSYVELESGAAIVATSERERMWTEGDEIDSLFTPILYSNEVSVGSSLGPLDFSVVAVSFETYKAEINHLAHELQSGDRLGSHESEAVTRTTIATSSLPEAAFEEGLSDVIVLKTKVFRVVDTNMVTFDPTTCRASRNTSSSVYKKVSDDAIAVHTCADIRKNIAQLRHDAAAAVLQSDSAVTTAVLDMEIARWENILSIHNRSLHEEPMEGTTAQDRIKSIVSRDSQLSHFGLDTLGFNADDSTISLSGGQELVLEWEIAKSEVTFSQEVSHATTLPMTSRPRLRSADYDMDVDDLTRRDIIAQFLGDMSIQANKASQTRLTIASFGYESSYERSIYDVSEKRSNDEVSEGSTARVRIVLSDSNLGDHFVMRMGTDPLFGTPVFKLLDGKSRCPHVRGTIRRESVSLVPATANQVADVTGVAPDGSAFWRYSLINTNPDEGADVSVYVSLLDNAGGMRVFLNGQAIGTGTGPFGSFDVSIPPLASGEPAPQLLLEARRDGTDAFVSGPITITAVPTCEFGIDSTSPDIDEGVSEQVVSVEFVSPCAQVVWADALGTGAPFAVLHDEHEPHDETKYLITGFVRNPLYSSVSRWRDHPRLTLVRVQYAALGTEDFTDASGTVLLDTGANTAGFVHLYKRSEDDVDGSEAISAEGMFGLGAFTWDVSALPDGEYELVAEAMCSTPGSQDPIVISTMTPRVRGIIDRSIPDAAAPPRPFSGEYMPGESDVEFAFTEPVDCKRAKATVTVAGQLASPVSIECIGTRVRVYVDAALVDNAGALAPTQSFVVALTSIYDIAGNPAPASYSHTLRTAPLDPSRARITVAGLVGKGPVTDYGSLANYTAVMGDVLANATRAQSGLVFGDDRITVVRPTVLSSGDVMFDAFVSDASPADPTLPGAIARDLMAAIATVDDVSAGLAFDEPSASPRSALVRSISTGARAAGSLRLNIEPALADVLEHTQSEWHAVHGQQSWEGERKQVMVTQTIAATPSPAAAAPITPSSSFALTAAIAVAAIATVLLVGVVGMQFKILSAVKVAANKPAWSETSGFTGDSMTTIESGSSSE